MFANVLALVCWKKGLRKHLRESKKVVVYDRCLLNINKCILILLKYSLLVEVIA